MQVTRRSAHPFRNLSYALPLGLFLVLMAAATFLSGCGGGGAGGGPSSSAGGALAAVGNLQGVLLDGAGNPIADALVVVHSTPRSTTTGVDGSWVINGIESGNHTLEISAPNHLNLRLAVVVISGNTTMIGSNQTVPGADPNPADNPTASLLVPSSPGGPAGVTLKLRVNAQAAAGRTLTVHGYCPGISEELAFTDDGAGADLTAGDGVFTAAATIGAGWPAGVNHWRVVAVDSSNNLSAALDLPVRVLGDAGEVQGKVIAADTQGPLAGVRLRAATLDGSVVLDTITAADGTYSLWLPANLVMELSFTRSGYYGKLYAKGSVSSGEHRTVSPTLALNAFGSPPPFPELNW